MFCAHFSAFYHYILLDFLSKMCIVEYKSDQIFLTNLLIYSVYSWFFKCICSHFGRKRKKIRATYNKIAVESRSISGPGYETSDWDASSLVSFFSSIANTNGFTFGYTYIATTNLSSPMGNGYRLQLQLKHEEQNYEVSLKEHTKNGTSHNQLYWKCVWPCRIW